MKNNELDYILEEIKSLLEDSNDISNINKLLSKIDSYKINKKFGVKNQYQLIEEEDLLSKINLFNAIIGLILENPNIKNFTNQEERLETLALLYRITSCLYEQLIDNEQIDSLSKIKHITMYSLLSYLADNQTISNIFLEKYNSNLEQEINSINKLRTITKLEFYTYYLIITLVSNIKDSQRLDQLNQNIYISKKLLQEAQEIEMKTEKFDFNSSMKICAFGNQIYLVEIIKSYLFTGNIISSEKGTISSLIDIYSHNALNFIPKEETEFKLISHLIKYSFTRVAENSIWNISQKSPMIEKFIKDNMNNGTHFIYSLLPSQKKLINNVLTPKKSIIVSMPTSSGKSFLAEMQILFSLHNYKTEDFLPTVCYIVPTNALINQVEKDLKKDFKDFNFHITTALPYYEVDEIEDEILTQKHIDILISTPEKLESLIRLNHKSIQNTRLVVLDEAHNLGDSSRGAKFELVLTAIKQYINEANFLLLSPFISNSEEIADWLSNVSGDYQSLTAEWTPTRQFVGCNILKSDNSKSLIEFYKTSRNYLCNDNFKIELSMKPEEMKTKIAETTINNYVRTNLILNDFISQDGNILILCTGTTKVKKIAEKIYYYYANKGILKDISTKERIQEATEIINMELGVDNILSKCLNYGIAFHFSGLSSIIKTIIEDLIRDDFIKVICSTTTLAQGLNFPINTIIFDSISYRSSGNLSNSEFWNIAGRAGRAYKDKEAYIILPKQGSQEKTREVTHQYIKKDLENVISSLVKIFENYEDITFSISNYSQKDDYLAVINLMQYINHVLNISYDYNLEPNNLRQIRTIFNDSLFYKNLTQKFGYLETQNKVNGLIQNYIKHIKSKKESDLKNADQLGISDTSLSLLKKKIFDIKETISKSDDTTFLASKIILETKNYNNMAKIIEIISLIPELNIAIKNYGELDSLNISKILIRWVNGENITDIASSVKREGEDLSSTIEMCNKYLNGKMKSYMPWGINIYQNLTFDINSENAKILPSYIYYGVSNKEDVILSKIGIPRFALGNVKNILLNDNVQINISNMEVVKKKIKSISSNDYNIPNIQNKFVKNIINKNLV